VFDVIRISVSSHHDAVHATIDVPGNLLEFSVFMYILNAGYPDTEMTHGY